MSCQTQSHNGLQADPTQTKGTIATVSPQQDDELTPSTHGYPVAIWSEIPFALQTSKSTRSALIGINEETNQLVILIRVYQNWGSPFLSFSNREGSKGKHAIEWFIVCFTNDSWGDPIHVPLGPMHSTAGLPTPKGRAEDWRAICAIYSSLLSRLNRLLHLHHRRKTLSTTPPKGQSWGQQMCILHILGFISELLSDSDQWVISPRRHQRIDACTWRKRSR